jgi:predicted nucleic acid-binding protein
MAEEKNMIVVDSSIWIDYFQDSESKGARSLNQALLAGEDIALLPIILTEVLMGFKDERSFRSARGILIKVPQLPITSEICIHAAMLYRTLQKKGVTVRGAIDCIIAQACLNASSELMTLDRDFLGISRLTGLKLSSTS